MARRIYLDNAASTPLDPRVFSRMREAHAKLAGNPSSIHAEGLAARAAIEDSRVRVAGVFGAHPDEIIFTGGGTESNNLALMGAARAARDAGAGDHIVVSSFEHASVLAAARQLQREGFAVTFVDPDSSGIIDPAAIKDALTSKTVLVSVMLANNEIGTIQPVAEIAKVVRRARKTSGRAPYPLLHTDACQATGNIPVAVLPLGVDLLSANAHKAYGPKGIGVLYQKRGTRLSPLVFGGGQEAGLRSGTESVAAIVGCAEALEIAERMREKESARVRSLRDYCKDRLLAEIPHASVNGDTERRLPGNINISFAGIDSEQLVLELDAKGFAVSSGSACSARGEESRYVILSLGKDEAVASSAVRITLGRRTAKRDIDALLHALPNVIRKLRRYTPYA